MDKNNKGRIHWNADTYSNMGGLNIFTKDDTKRIINVTNNKAFYYSKLAKKYKDEAKEAYENAKYYAEQNSNLTLEQLIETRKYLEQKIDTKQDSGDYLLAADLPENVSAFTNDANYATESELTDAIDSIRLPEQADNVGKFLQTDGESVSWAKIVHDKLFDLKLFDRILTFEESKGYALQGTYVYKESAPERYGYPDFYAKCLEEYNNSIREAKSWTQPVLSSNGALGGSSFAVAASSVSNDNFAYKAFNNSSSTQWWGSPVGSLPSPEYLIFYNPKPLRVSQLKITNRFGHNVYITTGNVYGSNDNSAWTLIDTFTNNVAGESASWTIDLTSNTEYYKYYKLEVTSASFDATTATFGLSEVKITALEYSPKLLNANGHVFYDIADKGIIDDLFENNGVAWYYGIDEENERIFLPRNDKFIQLTTDTSKINQFNEAGLPNITGGSNRTIEAAYGALYGSSSPGRGPRDPHDDFLQTRFDASRSNPIYGNSDTVQPPSLNQLLYIVVGNTEIPQALTDVTEVTTTENDTIPLFTGMYFDFKPNNVSWLKAGEQQNGGEIYTSAYNTLVNCLTESNNIYDLKVIEESEMEADVDYSKYWKVNQDEMYFITPLTLSDSSTSALISEESPAQLYFKVANAVQNLELIDAGEVLESLANKTNGTEAAHAAMPSNRYIDLTLGASGAQYTAPADGWFYFAKVAGSDWYYCSLQNEINGLYSFASGYRTSPNTVILPVKKNDDISIAYNSTGTTKALRFIYAEGAKND